MKPATGYRWTICALIFFATTVNYLDRQLFSLLVPFFEDDLKLSPVDLALINVSFILPYGCAMLFVGQFIDRVGIKKGLTTTFLLWNIASVAHAVVGSLTGFMGARFALGLGESGMFPAAVKTMTDWFPRKERSLATGIFNAGSNMGALLAPLLGVWIAKTYGWRECFVFTGGVGVVWIFFWLPLYRDPKVHPKVSQSEVDHIHSDEDETTAPISLRKLFAIPAVLGLAVAKALSDAPWWFYLTWMPKFLTDQFHLTAEFMAWAILIIYVIADIGSVFGGWMSSTLIKHGKDAGAARKITMLVCALLVTPVMTVGLLVDHAPILGLPAVYWAIGIVSLAAGAHQGWSCNLFTLISDTVPKGSIGVAVGAINGCAMIGASAMQFFVGRSVQLGSYTAPFVLAGTLYLIALACLHIIAPKIRLTEPKRLAPIWAIAAGAIAIVGGLGVLQYEMNKPPYKSVDDYKVVRVEEIHAAGAPIPGPIAKVGWMSAQWFKWTAEGKPKYELVKLDQEGRPFIEGKGDKASRYKGPSKDDVIKEIGG